MRESIELLSIWEKDYNSNSNSVNWQFKTDDAWIKLKKLYPVFYM